MSARGRPDAVEQASPDRSHRDDDDDDDDGAVGGRHSSASSSPAPIDNPSEPVGTRLRNRYVSPESPHRWPRDGDDEGGAGASVRALREGGHPPDDGAACAEGDAAPPVADG